MTDDELLRSAVLGQACLIDRPNLTELANYVASRGWWYLVSGPDKASRSRYRKPERGAYEAMIVWSDALEAMTSEFGETPQQALGRAVVTAIKATAGAVGSGEE